MPLFRRGEAASTLDLLVAGLGNPGREYAHTRHNVGWMVLDELARRHGASWKTKFSGKLAEVRIDGARIALLKPETYMNESGRSIRTAAKFFKTPVDRVLVVHDDVDLEEGRLQARPGGGLAGAEATGGRSPTSCSPASHRRPTWKRSSSVGRTPSRPSCARASRRRSSASTDPQPAHSRHTCVTG